MTENRTRLENTLYSEQQIQVHVAPGITVDGRIDLITELDTGETSIVDFKSTERAQAEEITRDQLHIYAVGLPGADRAARRRPRGAQPRQEGQDHQGTGERLPAHRDPGQDRRRRRGPARQPAAPPFLAGARLCGLRPSRPLQESPVIIIDDFIESCYGGRSFDSLEREGRT